MIKARACAGDIAAGEALLNELAPFVWRKYLDFAAVADVHAMKRQINAYRGHGEIAVEGHNIKLGRGGIREIEFFAQTQQLIAGGRNPHLRDRDTLTTLDKLAEDRWIDQARARRHEGGLLLSCARSSTGCRWSTTSRRKRCRPSATASSASRAFSAYADRDAFAKVLRRSSRQGAAPLRASVRKGARRRPAGAGVSARCRRPQDARPPGRARLPRAAGSLGHRAPLACRRPPLAARRGRARAICRSCCRCCSSSWRAPTIPTPRWCCSTISSPICTARRGCCRCCGKTPI